jgi:hypothetical protein
MMNNLPMDQTTYGDEEQFLLNKIEMLEAQIAAFEKVLNMGFDDDSAAYEFIGEAEIDTDAVGGYRVIPKAEIERVLDREPECPHRWSVWQEADEDKEIAEALNAERACKWCGLLEKRLQHEVNEKIRPYPINYWANGDFWIWEDGNGQ